MDSFKRGNGAGASEIRARVCKGGKRWGEGGDYGEQKRKRIYESPRGGEEECVVKIWCEGKEETMDQIGFASSVAVHERLACLCVGEPGQAPVSVSASPAGTLADRSFANPTHRFRPGRVSTRATRTGVGAKKDDRNCIA